MSDLSKSVSKIDRYKWAASDAPGEMIWLDKLALEVDQTYQREAKNSKACDIAGSWSWMACGVITVARRRDPLAYYVIDGQHRVVAARKRADIQKLPCIVFDVQDRQTEATGFIAANTLRKPITTVERFNALIVSGDATAIALKQVLDRFGLHITKNAKNPKQVKCLRAMYDLMGTMKTEDFILLISMCRELSVTKHVAEPIVVGLSYIHRNIQGGLRDERLRRRIVATGDAKILEGALKSAAIFSRGHAKAWGIGILNVVNSGLHHKFELCTQSMA